MTNRRPSGIETYRPGSEHGGPRGTPHAASPSGPPRRGRKPGSRRRPHRQRSSSFGTFILIFAVGLFVLIGAGLAVLFIAPPTDLIREQLVSQVKSTTGRDLAITGPASLTFYPGLGFSLQGVSLSPPPGMQGPPFVRMKSLNVQVRFLPLLSRKVVVDQFVLEDPVFDFRIDKKGRKSWDFAALSDRSQPRRHVQLAQADAGTRNDAASPGSGGNLNVAALDQLELGDVRILNGKVRYSNAAEVTRENLDNINMTFALKSLDKPLSADGNMRYRGDRINFQAVLNSLKQILSNRPADLDATVNSDRFFVKYDGLVDATSGMRLDGNVSVQTKSVRQLARWLGTKLPPATGFGPLRLSGRLIANGPVYRLSKLDAEIDNAKADGDITADTSQAIPKVSGNLSLSVLDLNKYMPPSGAGNRKPRSGKTVGAAKKAKAERAINRKGQAGGQAPNSIEDLIGQSGPRVKGYSKRQGWSNEPIDFSAFELLDADLNLRLGKLLYEKITVGRSLLAVTLVDRLLTAKLNEMELYEGVGRGVLTVNAATRNPAFGANFNLSGVSAQPLLTDAAEIGWLAGKGQLLLAVTSAGENQQAIVSALNGTASFAFENGAVVGVNVPKMVRGIQQGRFTDLKGAPNEQTDFTKLTGSFSIKNGVAVNQDLEMLSPLLRVGGEGKVILPGRRVDYTVKPKLVASLSGQGGDRNAKGLEIPVRVHGPFENLSYTPDLNGVLKNPGAIRELGRQYGGEKAGKVIDNLLGGGEGGGGKAKELLDGLLGGR